MRQARKAVVASLLKAASTAGAVPFVVTSKVLDEDFIKKTELANYGCDHCGTVTASNAGLEPFCVTCGSDEVREWTESAIPPSELSSAEFASVTCSKCGTHNVMTMQTASTLKGLMSCASCGTEIAYSLGDDEAVEEVDEMDVEEDAEMDDDITEMEEIAPSDDSDEVMDSEEASEDDDDMEEDELSPDEGEESDVAKDIDAQMEEDSDEEYSEADENDGDDADSEENVGDGEDEGDDDDSEETDDGEDTDDDAEVDFDEESKMCTASLIGLMKGDVILSRVEDTIVASINGVPVAVLEEAKSQDYKESFHGRNFISAINHSIKTLGKKKALASFGFETIQVKIPLKKVALSAVEKQVSAKTKEVAASKKAYAEDLRQCLSLASMLMTKGVLKGRTNVIKAAMLRELSSIGINPSTATNLINRVFASNGKAYHKDLLEYASEIMSKPLESRNELAELVEDIDSEALNPEVEDDEIELVESSVENRLQTPVSIRKPRTVEKSSVSKTAETSSVATIAETVRATHGRLF